MITPARPLDVLHIKFGDKVQENISLAPYTAARIGGPADIFIIANSVDDLVEIMTAIWQQGLSYIVLGGGSNVLVSDKGVRGAVVLNRARKVKFYNGDQLKVWVESGVTFSNLANRCASKGLSGLEWAAGIPGTVGGAVVGNAGAFGSDMSGNLTVAEVLTKNGREQWPVEKMGYGYRTSVLKGSSGKAIVLSAELRLKNAIKDSVSAKIGQFSERRKRTQPPGASMGSMFKNPDGDRAGRLIEAAGLKGTRIGNAEISPLHGNFFVNYGETKASDMRALIELAQKTVMAKFGVNLELEVELIGDWSVER
jgi:UDP-N-acetylmuramate dehydrogenase